MMPLTKKQSILLGFLKESMRVDGFCPSFEEIGKHMGITSISTVHKHIHNLERRGYIICYPNRSRSLEIVEVKEGRFTMESDDLLWDNELKCYWTRGINK